MSQLGSYGKGELQFLLEHKGVILAEILDFKYDIDIPKIATGSGLGDLHNKRFKRTGAPKGTWSMSRNMLSKAEGGEDFLNLMSGSETVIQEAIATSSASYTPGQTLVSILEIKGASGAIYEEGTDFTVNYLTGVITFTVTTTEASTIKYLSTDTMWLAPNLIQNGGFEVEDTGVWLAISCTLTRSATTPYVGLYKAALTAINAANDGLQYLPDTTVVPNRVYHFSFWAKAAAADDCVCTWTDSVGATSMTPVGTAATFSTGWKLHEFTFTPDEASILSIQITNTTVAPGATLDIDQVRLAENAPSVSAMAGGSSYGFSFNVKIRRKDDGVVVTRLIGCELFKGGFASGDTYKEDISGEFVDIEGE